MFDYIAIDWGEKLTGIAVGSSFSGLVLPHFESVVTQKLISVLDDLIQSKKPTHLLVGYPVTFTGKKTRVTTLIDTFVTGLKELYPQCMIVVYNERGTTKAAQQKIQKKSQQTDDGLSAASLLEQYFRYELHLSSPSTHPK